MADKRYGSVIEMLCNMLFESYDNVEVLEAEVEKLTSTNTASAEICEEMESVLMSLAPSETRNHLVALVRKLRP